MWYLLWPKAASSHTAGGAIISTNHIIRFSSPNQSGFCGGHYSISACLAHSAFGVDDFKDDVRP